MDSNTIMSTVAIVVSVLGSIVAVINHKRIRSNCCGLKLEAALDVEDTSPPNLKIKVPPV